MTPAPGTDPGEFAHYGPWKTETASGQWYWAVVLGARCRFVRAGNATEAARRAFSGEAAETVVRLSPRKSLAQLKLTRLARMSNARWSIEELD